MTSHGNPNNPYRNAEGYYDPTAGQVLIKIDLEEYERFNKLLHTIFYLCELAGFEIGGRIVLIDNKSGRIWR